MRRVLIVLASLIALVAAGCGGSDDGGGGGVSKQDYARQLSQATAALRQAFDDLAKTSSDGTSTKAAAARLEKGASALEQAADRFDAITPPEASKDAHEKIVDGLRKMASQFQQGADAAKKGDAAAVAKALQGIAGSAGAREIQQAQQELQRQGVTVTTP
ncbi:MAG TPA: hypothetical protein VFT50_13845 [Baekduia sp.]|nr:hypothetical protein [Baekduia sp.]